MDAFFVNKDKAQVGRYGGGVFQRCSHAGVISHALQTLDPVRIGNSQQADDGDDGQRDQTRRMFEGPQLHSMKKTKKPE